MRPTWPSRPTRTFRRVKRRSRSRASTAAASVSSNRERRVIASRPDVSWAASSPGSVRSYDPDTGAATTISQNVQRYFVSSIGTILLLRADGQFVVPAIGGTEVSIGNGHPFEDGDFTHDGRALIYESLG